MLSQTSIAHGIFSCFTVLPTIDFDDQVEFTADKVADVTADRHLSREFVPVDLAIADTIPEEYFGIGLIDA